MHGKHEAQVKRLCRIEGQVRGIRKMVEEGRYCIDIATQIKAARSALKQAGLAVLDTHLRTCVADAMRSRSKKRMEVKIREIITLLQSWE